VEELGTASCQGSRWDLSFGCSDTVLRLQLPLVLQLVLLMCLLDRRDLRLDQSLGKDLFLFLLLLFLQVDSDMLAVVAIGLPLPGMKPALEFLAENSGSFQVSVLSSCRPCGKLRRTSSAKPVEAWGLFLPALVEAAEEVFQPLDFEAETIHFDQ